jgi:hypothetical protein
MPSPGSTSSQRTGRTQVPDRPTVYYSGSEKRVALQQGVKFYAQWRMRIFEFKIKN